MQIQQRTAAKGACFWIKILHFHLLANLLTTWDEQTKVNGSYAPAPAFWGVIEGLSAFPPRAPPSIPSTAAGDPCALLPFTKSEIWGFSLLHHSLYAPGMREMLLSCCCTGAQRAALGQERLVAPGWAALSLPLSSTHVQAARTRSSWCPRGFFFPLLQLVLYLGSQK